MFLMMSSTVREERGAVMILCPSRSTVTRSATSCSSSSRWEMYAMETPPALRFLMISKSLSTSLPVSGAVGSSITMMSAFSERAFAISTTCW